ncbi:MAG: transcription antitermination factor NusB [Chloroflexota bacterium]|nr:transcription antitermination factor NusB [Chloroflexota bacterium]
MESTSGESQQPHRSSTGKQPAARKHAGGQRPIPGGKRHQARILTLQILFEVDVTSHRVDDVFEHALTIEETSSSLKSHVRRLVYGVMRERDAIDPYIVAAAPAFPIPQLPPIDRNVLRLAIFELLHEPAVPLKAAINEAVELAKRFGGDNSGRFVNGVLGTVADRLAAEGLLNRPPPQPAGNG